MWDGVVLNGEHHYVDHIYYMIHARPFGLSVLRPYLHMLGSSSLILVLCMRKTGLHSLYVNVELITPDHYVVSQHEELSQQCILRENTYTLKFSKESSYNATAVLSKIRRIKDKHRMQSKYVTWYGIIILCLWSPSPKHRHDLHRHRLDTLISIVASLSSHQLLLLRLSLPLSDKVKQLHGDCISYNKATTIRLLPVVDNFYKTWSSHTTIYISSRLDKITSQHALQK